MKNTPFTIYATLSLLVAMFVLRYQPIEKTVFELIKNRMTRTNQILQKINQKKLKEIQKQVEYYPQYQKYQKAAQQVDSFTQQQLADLSNVDLIYFSDSLFAFFDKNDVKYLPKKEFTTEIDSLINASNDDFYNALKINQIIFKQTLILNYFAKKTEGTEFRCWFGPDFVFFETQGCFLKNKPTTINFGLAGFPKKGNLMNQKIWVNDVALATRDGKSRFKHKITRSGWHDMKVKITAEYLGKPIEKEMVYQYYVCP